MMNELLAPNNKFLDLWNLAKECEQLCTPKSAGSITLFWTDDGKIEAVAPIGPRSEWLKMAEMAAAWSRAVISGEKPFG